MKNFRGKPHYNILETCFWVNFSLFQVIIDIVSGKQVESFNKLAGGTQNQTLL